MKKDKLFNSDRTLLKSEMLPFYEIVELDNGEAMLFQGELTSDFFIIKSGKLEVVEGSGSKAVRLDTLEEGRRIRRAGLSRPGRAFRHCKVAG